MCITKECGEIRDSPNRKAFLFIHNNKVTAAAITETPDDTRTSLMNIIVLWTAIQWRRKGMASHLITTIANKSRYSLIIPTDRITFPFLTEDGAQFWKAYSNKSSREE